MNLEDKAVGINPNLVYRIEVKEGFLEIYGIKGDVKSAESKADASGRKCLRIQLDSETQKEHIGRLNFYGASPVKGGNRVRAGLILTEEVIKHHDIGEAFYIEIIDERGHYIRRDFRDGCEGNSSNLELGLED